MCTGDRLSRSYIFCLIFLSLVLSAPANAQVLIVQGDLWCPYNCEPGAAQAGYVIDVLHAVFDRNGIKFRYEVVPWYRTLLQTRDGRASIAVVATQKEAQQYGLLIGRALIGISSDCLYVAAANKLKYAKAEDLDALKALGISAGYIYSDEIGAWLGRRENKNKIRVQTGDRPSEINAMNLALGRLDGAIEDDYVMRHVITKLKLEGKIALAGCGKATPVYVAFSPKLENAQKLVAQFDDGLEELRQNDQLAKILAKYGLSEWK